MGTRLSNWLREVASAGIAPCADGVSPSVPGVVSGVSRGVGLPSFAGSLAAVGVCFAVASCAQPKLDPIPEDPGDNLPIPTIGPPPEMEIPYDAGETFTSDDVDGNDRSDDEHADAGNIDETDATQVPGNQDASIDYTDSSEMDTTDAFADAGAPNATSTATSTVQSTSAAGSSTGAVTGTSEVPTSDGTDTTETGSDSTDTDPTDTSGVEADAGWWYPDAGAGETSHDGDAGDAGDAGDSGVEAGVEP